MLLHSVQIRGHGTNTGIWPRFFFQMDDLAQWAIGKQEFEDRSTTCFNNVMPNIEKFYDIYHKFIEMLNDYREGIQSGKYFNVDGRGQSNHNKIPEREISDKVQEFFIHGKIMIVNFVKSGIIDDRSFQLQDYYFADEKKFVLKKDAYLKNSNGFYLPIIDLLERAQEKFLKPYNKIRGEIEQDHFTINDFKLEVTQNGAFVFDPIFDGRILSESIKSYYENILELIEKLIAYYLGLRGESQKNFLQLVVRREYDFPKMLYKYVFAIGGNVLSADS